MIRSFIAIDIPEPIRRKLDDFVAKLKESRADVKWVKSRSMHLTLKFLGNMGEDRIPKIKGVLQNVAGNIRSFIVSIEGTGTFPSGRKPRVIWAGVQKGSETLIRLASDLNSQLAALGFEPEKRSYSPHLTIGRVRSPEGIDAVVGMLHSTVFQGGDFTCEDILLIKSDLRPEGAIYTVLERIKLQG